MKNKIHSEKTLINPKMETLRTMSKKAGLPPGALVHVGKKRTDYVKVSVIDYDEDNFSESICSRISESFAYKEKKSVSWINIDGLHDTDLIASIGDHFNLHPLLLEDVLNTRHRPKIEEFDQYIFFTFKMLGLGETGKTIVSEQVSLVLGNNWVISFQEQEGDIFNGIRERLRDGVGTIRQRGTDFLLYRLIDTVVDNYFIVTEYLSESIEDLEELVLDSPEDRYLKDIQRLRKQIINFRRMVSPLRETVAILQKDAVNLIEESTTRYLRDVYEHIIQLMDSIEAHRDMVSTIMDLYLSGVSHKMNQVMQVLTIMATIFIPLTFIAGIYGMNFDHMPELHWKYGYFMIWGIMVLVILVMVVYFKRKKWL